MLSPGRYGCKILISKINFLELSNFRLWTFKTVVKCDKDVGALARDIHAVHPTQQDPS
jgi:hypothetical protein